MVCLRTSFEDERVHETAVEPHPRPDAGLCVIRLLSGHQVVEVAIEVRHRQHRQHPDDRLVLRRSLTHTYRLADGSDVRPKKKPAVISISDAAYAHQIGTARASDLRTNVLIPIMASDTAKHTAPSAVHGVRSRASSAAHTIAPSTAMYTVTGIAIPSEINRGQNHTSRPM